MPKYLEKQIDAVEQKLSEVSQSSFYSVLETATDIAGHFLMPGTYGSLKKADEVAGNLLNAATNKISEPISDITNVDQRAVNTALQLGVGGLVSKSLAKNGVKKTVPTRQSLSIGISRGKFRSLNLSDRAFRTRTGQWVRKGEIGAIGDVSAKYRSISDKDAELLREQVARAVTASNFTGGKMDISDRLLITPPQEIAPSPIAYNKTAYKKAGMEQHHLLPKMQVAEIYRRLLQVGDIDDLSNMMSWMTQAGNHAGDRLDALLLINKKPHRATHGLAKKTGLEPTNRMKLKTPLSLLKTRQEVFEFMDNYLETNLKPSKELFIKAQKDFENLSTSAQKELKALLQYRKELRRRGS